MVWPYQQQTGRPRDLPREESGIDVRARIAWLLRVSRMASDAGGTGSEFARRIGRHGFPESPSWLSRRETGQEPIPPSLINAYEVELGLGAGHLRAPCESMAHSLGGGSTSDWARGPRRTGDRAATLREIDQVADKINNCTASGHDWLGFSELVGGPHGMVLPTVLLDQWALQLVHEMMRSIGGEYACRHEALSRMMRDTVTRDSVARAVYAAVGDPSAQATLDAWVVLGESDDPAFHLQLVKELAREEGHRRHGISLALMHPMHTGSFDVSVLPLLSRVLVGIASDNSPGAQHVARMMAAELPPPLRATVLRAAGPIEAPATTTANGAPDLHRACFEAAVQHSGMFDDPMLARLIGEAVTPSLPEHQHHSNLLLTVSPYRDVLADAAIVASSKESASAATRSSASTMLSYQSGLRQQAPLVRMLRGSIAEQLTGLRGLAHGSGVPHDVSLVPHLSDPSTADQAMYAAGMSGHPDLQLVRGAPRFGSTLRGKARWWLTHGPALGRPTAVVA